MISSAYQKDPTDPAWAKDAGMKEWRAFMTKYLPDADMTDRRYVSGYSYGEHDGPCAAACGNDLSRENIMRQADQPAAVADRDAAAGDQAEFQPDQLPADQEAQPDTRFGPGRSGSGSAI